MSYLALARKWRPRNFSQLVGQEHINKALINSLNQQRLHHAYLFTGTRGVGKTSIARLLAKALNCEKGISAEPCLICDACLAIEQGRFIDLIEIDGASRTRVEDTRELLENVQYSPTNGRFKIYLIDEVHMLSQHSFNALLKTLEEPPAHVKFLLATTDPQKLPVTVLSRCLQFSLKHLPPEIIGQHLQYILNDEQMSFEMEAIELLAKAAKGSMRDALSLLDQAIASTDKQLKAQDLKLILGYTQQDYAIQLLHALAKLDAQELIYLSRQIASEGGHFRYVLDELLDYLHQITINQSLASDNPLISSRSEIKALAKQFSPEDVQLFYQIGIKGTEDLYSAPTLDIGFEMTLLRMLTFRPAPKVEIPPLAYETVEKPGSLANSEPNTFY
ncbi:DNA polymerase III subunit gamma/tau [Legionella drozanskii]|uniref:DNA polymerase III subunit gamma/tau n=1 Tax=Legionella drozanskii TaxID=96228 RepID=UPI0013EFC43D|nr:DNA polymerase III subunit gamma/tau [Legionella drozanskii]